MTLILGLESSCDETAAALVRDGHTVLAERIASQADTFADWGGVVPEIAARGHVAWLPGLVEAVLADAGCTLAAVDAVAVAAWPGLLGSLLGAFTCAKTIALVRGLPLLTVDHVEAHLAAIALGRDEQLPPLVGLVASGGHSHYYHCPRPDTLAPLGGTIDDAAGEAFDKAAAMLELGYPGGPIVDRLAATGDPNAYDLPRSFLREPQIRLSFAGLKTALLYKVRGPRGRDALTLDARGIADACASFQAAVVDCLASKLLLAAQQCGVEAVAVGGGVACNRALRQRLETDCAAAGLALFLPAPRHCADNAAMVAALGQRHLRAGRIAAPDCIPLPTGAAGPRAQLRT